MPVPKRATRFWFTQASAEHQLHDYIRETLGQSHRAVGRHLLPHRQGTADKPIAIKAAGDGEVIFDGNGTFNLFNVKGADYHHFEGMTFRNTESRSGRARSSSSEPRG